MDLFCGDFGAVTGVVWVKDKSKLIFQPLSGIGVEKQVWSQWELSSSKPFPGVPILLSQPQWLEKQSITQDLEPLMGPRKNLELYFIPFEYHLTLTGFAILGLSPNYPIGEAYDALTLIKHQVAASLQNSYLYEYLHDQRNEMKLKLAEFERVTANLMEADRFKSEFLALISHELRTPLTGILGFTKLVIDGIYEDEEEMRQMLQDSYSSGRHLLHLLNNILDFAKIESGLFKIDLEPVSLQKEFLEIKAVAHTLTKKPNVVINWPDNLEAIPEVIADPSRLRQVMINLISNALKFTSEGTVSVVVERGIGVVNFSVIDTGIGVSPEVQLNLFQKYTQADGGHARKYGGTGLGLAICKYLVEMMNGNISLHSEGRGRGTAVSFTLLII
jgi:signal transduction histidine kinase